MTDSSSSFVPLINYKVGDIGEIKDVNEINNKYPFPEINLEENLETLLEIYLQNMDKNVKIDNVLILCIKKLMKFFETMPRLRHAVNITNPNTKVKSEVVIEGLESFLA